jgi:hypothetical protein
MSFRRYACFCGAPTVSLAVTVGRREYPKWSILSGPHLARTPRHDGDEVRWLSRQ